MTIGKHDHMLFDWSEATIAVMSKMAYDALR